ncbi:kelch-like protein 24 [Branchiostoma lanceolatum]|uniref:kelch-like protein 24 n=1 Tax=Branchiostoma lanceolatum TaxID=7740 RepID=UPI003454F3EF
MYNTLCSTETVDWGQVRGQVKIPTTHCACTGRDLRGNCTVGASMDDGGYLAHEGNQEYPPWFLQRLQELRSEGHLFDVTLCAEGTEIRCHRLVLSAFGDYFKAMFCGVHNESKMDKIEIGGVSAEALQLLVDYAYTSKIAITDENIHTVYEAANMLQIECVEYHCEDFLMQLLNPETCLGTWVLADKLLCKNLSAMARTWALKHFEEACMSEHFLELPLDFLKTYVSDDDLHAEKEGDVIKAIMLWARHDLGERQTHLKDLLTCVRFSHVDQSYLKDILETDKEFAELKELMKNQSACVQARSCQTFQGEILVLGGMTAEGGQEEEHSNNMYRLDLYGNCLETILLPVFLENSSGFAACAVGGDVIVTRGLLNLTTVWRYNPSLNSWTWLASLGTERCYHGMAVLQGQVYVVGGVAYEAEPISDWVLRDSTEVYSEETNSWSAVAPLKQAVSNFGMTSCCEKMYVFGGKIAIDGVTDAVQCYDPTQNEWTFAAPLPTGTICTTACSVNSKIYLVSDCIVCYNPKEDLYEELAELPFSWPLSSATVCGSEIFITGGYLYDTREDHKGVPPVSSQCYNVNSDAVVLAPMLPIPLWGHCSVTIPKLGPTARGELSIH